MRDKFLPPKTEAELSLDRVRIKPGEDVTLTLEPKREVCLYSLKGLGQLWDSGGDEVLFGTARLSVQAAPAPEETVLYRVIPNQDPARTVRIQAVQHCDFLVITAPVLALSKALAQTGYEEHAIGTGTHARIVRHYRRPAGFTIDAGETLNIPGGWSSWPAHATPEEARTRYAEHHELFFCITPGPYALMHCNGFMPGGAQYAKYVQRIQNGDAVRVPLGAHEIVAAPGAWLWYAWFYVSFLQKQYNIWATDVQGTYVR